MLWVKLEASYLGPSNEYPQYMVLWRSREDYPRINIKYSFLTSPLYEHNNNTDTNSLPIKINKSCVKYDKNQQNGMCTQWRLRSAWISAQSDKNLCCGLIR